MGGKSDQNGYGYDFEPNHSYPQAKISFFGDELLIKSLFDAFKP